MRLDNSDYHQLLLSCAMPEDLAAVLARQLLSVGFRRALIFSLSSDQQALVPIAESGKPPLENFSIRLALKSAPFTRKVLQGTEPLVCRQPSDNSSYGEDKWAEALARDNLRLWVEAPLVTPSQKKLGLVLCDLGPEEATLPPTYLTAVAQLAETFSAHFERQLALRQAEETASAYRALLTLDTEIAQQLAKAYGQSLPAIAPIFHFLADKIIHVTEAAFCDISLPMENTYRPIAEAGELSGVGQSASLNDDLAVHSISLRAVHAGAPEIFLGKRTDRLYNNMKNSIDENRRPTLERMRAWGAFPVTVNYQVCGVISICSPSWDFFSPWRIGILEQFAQKTALILSLNDLVTDVSMRLQEQEAETRRLTERLTDVARRASYAEAARTVVHNLGNLLSPIAQDLLSVKAWLTNQRKRVPKKALGDLEERFKTIEEVIGFYQKLRTGIPDRKYHQINKLLEEAREFCKYKSDAYSIYIDIRPASGDPEVYCADAELLQVFMNIIVNSIEAMSDPQATGNRLLIRAWLANEEVFVKFEDEGVGIKNAQIPKIWDSDFSTKLERGGTGLGIPHVKQIVSSYKGSVDVESKYGKGTTVTVVLPGRIGGKK